MNREKIERDLLAGFEIADGQAQQTACEQAIRDIGDKFNESGMFCDFMIELRDFLLEQTRFIK